MKTYPLIILLLLCIGITNTTTYEKNCNYEDMHIGKLYAPITMTGSGIDCFIKNIYNNPNYADMVLPYSFAHLTQLLEYGLTTKQTRSFVQSTLRLFSNKMKACSFIDADAFNALLTQLTHLLPVHCTPAREYAIDGVRKKIDNIVYTQFLQNFEVFKTDPNSFLDGLSHSIFNEMTVETTHFGHSSVEELQKTTLVFLEVGLSRIVWNPASKHLSWHLVKALSENLIVLLERSALTSIDDLNGLFISLLERYCMFIELFAQELPKEFYDTVLHEVTMFDLPFLNLEEQEEYIEPKKQRLLRTIMHAKARCYAYNHTTPSTATRPE